MLARLHLVAPVLGFRNCLRQHIVLRFLGCEGLLLRLRLFSLNYSWRGSKSYFLAIKSNKSWKSLLRLQCEVDCLYWFTNWAKFLFEGLRSANQRFQGHQFVQQSQEESRSQCQVYWGSPSSCLTSTCKFRCCLTNKQREGNWTLLSQVSSSQFYPCRCLWSLRGHAVIRLSKVDCTTWWIHAKAIHF